VKYCCSVPFLKVNDVGLNLRSKLKRNKHCVCVCVCVCVHTGGPGGQCDSVDGRNRCPDGDRIGFLTNPESREVYGIQRRERGERGGEGERVAQKL
jgi:hypothetical protein